MKLPLQYTLTALLLAPAALAGDVVIEATSTVTVATASGSSPFAGIATGDAVLVHLELFTPGVDIAPGQFTRYTLDAANSNVTIGGITDSLNGGSVSIQNDFPVADGIRQGGGPLAGGGSLTLDVSESSGTLFSSTDVLANLGTWGPGTWASFQFTVTGGGSFIEFDLPTITIELPTISSTIFCPQPPNSTGAGGTLAGFGSTLVADDDVTLVASNMLPGQFGIFVTSMDTGSVPVGPGFLCLAGAIGRFNAPGQIRQVDASGSFELALDLNQTPTPNSVVSIQPGETWHYQAWYRDIGTPAPNDFGFTEAMSVTYQ